MKANPLVDTRDTASSHHRSDAHSCVTAIVNLQRIDDLVEREPEIFEVPNKPQPGHVVLIPHRTGQGP